MTNLEMLKFIAQPSTVNRQLSTANRSTVNRQPSTVTAPEYTYAAAVKIPIWDFP